MIGDKEKRCVAMVLSRCAIIKVAGVFTEIRLARLTTIKVVGVARKARRTNDWDGAR